MHGERAGVPYYSAEATAGQDILGKYGRFGRNTKGSAAFANNQTFVCFSESDVL